MSPEPEYKIRKEEPPTEESCLAFIRSLMSRNLNEEEAKGIKVLIAKHGPVEIQGQAADLKRETEQMAEESETPWIDKYLKKYSGVYPTIHEWMTKRIERQKKQDDRLASAPRRVINQIINSPIEQSFEHLSSAIRGLDDLSRK